MSNKIVSIAGRPAVTIDPVSGVLLVQPVTPAPYVITAAEITAQNPHGILYPTSTIPAPVTRADSVKGADLTSAELAQNFANLRANIAKLVGEANDATEEAALFAAGYVFVIRLDLVDGYTPPTGTTTTTTPGPEVAPTSTIIFSNLQE